MYLFIFLKKNWDNNFIGPYIWISSALIKKWVLLEQESYLNVKKYLRLWQDFGNWMKNLTIAFMLMVSLCIHIWCDFVTFKSVHANVLFLYLLKSSENLWFSDVGVNIWGALEYHYHFKKCTKFYMPNRQYWTHFFPMHPFSTPLNHQKALRFSDVFRGVKKRCIGSTWVNHEE